MVKTLKIVDIAQEAQPAIEETQIEQPIEEPIQEESIKEIVIEESPATVAKPTEEPIHGKTAKTPEEIVCEHCNKKMLMKTYKYSHRKGLQSKSSSTSSTSPTSSTSSSKT